jgi:hypothetical protein
MRIDLELQSRHASFYELQKREREACANAYLALSAAVLNGCAHATTPELFLPRLKQLP